jgi:hypothetical protein
MKKLRSEKQSERFDQLSLGLFGEPAEVGSAEAEELLRCAGTDPDQLKARLYERLYDEAQLYRRARKPLPARVKRALDDLRPLKAPPRSEKDLARQAKRLVERVLEQVNRLPSLVEGKPSLVFAEAYRQKRELSARDKKLLDRVTDDLRRRIEDHKKDS